MLESYNVHYSIIPYDSSRKWLAFKQVEKKATNPTLCRLTALWKPGEDQVSCQMKGNAMTLMAFAHVSSRRGGISIRIKPGIGPVYREKCFK